MKPSIEAGSYREIPELNKFAGEWKYADSVQTFRLVLRKEKIAVENRYMDFILGNYCHQKKGKEIPCSLSSRNTIRSGSFLFDKSHNSIFFLFIDLIKEEKLGNGILRLLPKNPNEAEWTLKNTGGTKYPGEIAIIVR
jgi:hypothetical protein